MRYRFLLGAGIAVAALLSWGNAQAQWFARPAGPPIWYFGGEGGWTTLEDESGRIGLPARLGGSTRLRERFDDGFNVGARAGLEWGPWRLEEEFRFQQNGINRLSIGPTTFNKRAVSGDRNAYAIMTNVIYDFALGWRVTPHLGGGVGAVELRDAVELPRVGTFAHSDDWQFGYQGIAGVRYNINPALAFDLDYRYLATLDPSFHVRRAVFGAPVRYKSGYDTHSILASLTLRFGPPPVVPPPLPPAPPPVTARVFLVFFDWDRATITPEGMEIVRQAADAYRSGAPVQIQVTGYTDRSGSPGYNQRLSERRAGNVANALVRFGVPREQMIVAGRGENDNRVPTAPGVREPQNRRVEIVFP